MTPEYTAGKIFKLRSEINSRYFQDDTKVHSR